ncbi:MAG: GntR family transcriptional regulator [bacterium]|jgi:GntR family transcriptional regulator
MRIVDRQNPQKLYLQLVEIIQNAIDKGELSTGSQLPTEDDLCKLQGVSKAVVRGAMQELVRKGYIRKIPGKGTFIQKPLESRGVWLATQLTENLLDFGVEWETRVVQKMLSVSPSDLRNLFAGESEYKVLKIIRLRSIDAVPVVHETAYVSHELCPGLALEDLRSESLIEVIPKKYGVPIDRCADSVGITTLEEKEAELLGKKTGDNALLADRILYTTNSRVVAFVRIINISENHRITFEGSRFK